MPAAAPAGPDHGARRWARRYLLLAGAAVVVLALTVGLLGGFGTRTDYVVLAPGDEVDAGNLVFTLDSATARPDTDYTGAGIWTIEVSGTVRNPHDTSLAPITGDRGNLAVRTGPGGTVASLESVTLGDATSRTQVPPGNHALAMVASFVLPGDFEPGPDLQCGVFVQEYTANTILDLDDTKYWNVDSFARPRMVTVPLTVLPPQE